MKRMWKRPLASLLCALLLCSDLSGLAPRALAAPDPDPAETSVVTDTGAQLDFHSETNGRPNLFVSFLGDNSNHIYDKTGVNASLALRSPTSLSALSVPAPYDQSIYTNPTGPNNTWDRYIDDRDCLNTYLNNTVFWVGLGVDRAQLLELLRDGAGLTSLEAGFYYDSRIIEPYIDPTQLPGGVSLATASEEQKQAAYQATIAQANIDNPRYPENTQWSSDYTVVRALPGVEPPETDPVTREEMERATIQDILGNTLYTPPGQSQWKMTYISLELKDMAATPAHGRLAGVYTGVDGLETGVDAEGNEVPVTPASAQGDQYITDGDPDSGYDYNYLLLIPFRLKHYGTSDWTPLRLVRDATHLSIGGGTWGVDDYGAWERSTTRNPAVSGSEGDSNTLSVQARTDRDLKLLTRFAGDLNLFAVGRTNELEYDALLRIIGDGGSLNHAKLTVKDDPAVWPVWADTNGDVIRGLQSGQGMRLDVHTQTNYVATITVTYLENDGSDDGRMVYHQYTQTASGANDNVYEFVMPEFDPFGARRVTVTVAFAYHAGDNALIYLTEQPQPGDADHVVGNETTIRASLDSGYEDTADTETINSYSPTSDHPNYSHPGLTHPDTPVVTAKRDQYAQIQVSTHADYMAVVQIYDFRAQSFITGGLTINATGFPGVTPDLTEIDNPAHLADPTDDSIPAKIPSGRIVMPQGGTIGLRMGSQDLDVIVTYEAGAQRQATLEVYNTDPAAENFDLNTAQLVYDLYDELDQPGRGYSAVAYQDVTPEPDDHRAIKGTDKLPWVSDSQAALSGSLSGDAGQSGKTWNPNALPDAQREILGSRTVMALLAMSAQKADFQAAVNGLDLATAVVDDGSADGLVGLRKSPAGEVYGDPDVSAPLDVDPDQPTVIDALWELRQAIDGDTSSGGLRDTYRKTITRGDGSVACTYYDLTPAQLQAYLLEIFDAARTKAENDLAYRIAYRRYLTILSGYNAVKDIPAYEGIAPLMAPAKNLSTTVTGGLRQYQGPDYKDTYLQAYDTYLDDYQTYLDELVDNAGTGGSSAPTAPTSYPGATAPARLTISLKTDAAAVSAVGAYPWTSVSVPTQVPAGQDGNTIETRSGRTVYIVLEADSAYELDLAGTDVFVRGDAPGYATGAPIPGATPVIVPGYQNVYAFTMPDQDCVVRVAYKLRGTRKLNITYRGAAGQDDNEAVVEVYSVATPASATPKFNQITNRGYTSGTLPSGGSYDADADVYTPDPVEDAFKGSTVTIRARAAEGYELKNVEARNSDETTITVTRRPADDPAEGDVYTFTIADSRDDDIDLVITYGPEVEEAYTATINSSTEGSVDGDNRAFWYVENGGVVTTPRVLSGVQPGTHLLGHVTVAPGYYIKSVTAWGASGGYPYTLTGDGYNNGFGTALTGADVPIEIYVDMPHEDLVVDVVFAQGPPAPAPDNALTLIVKDDDNADPDPAKAAANWARAQVFDARPADLSALPSALQTLPTVGLRPGDHLGKNAAHGNGALTDRKYVETGKWVLVDFSAAVVMKADASEGAAPGAMVVDTDRSYYVSSVTVGPEDRGVALVWEGPTMVSFYMPAGSASVTVEFSKYPASGRLPDYVLTVHEFYVDPASSGEITTDLTSYVTSARSATIGRWSTILEDGSYVPGRALDSRTNPELVPPLTEKNGTGAATAGEQVTMTYTVDAGTDDAPGWYVQSVALISDGAVTRLTYDAEVVDTQGTVTTYQVKFFMPAGEAEFVVNYRRGAAPDIPEYPFTLTLSDPDNVYDAASGTWDENSVRATFHDPTGTTEGHAYLEVGRNKSAMTATRHIHAGDIITLNTAVADGYYLQYMIVNPAGLNIHPVWSDATTASFVMPSEGVAVVAKVVKGTPQSYTANLILRYEDENGSQTLPLGKTIHDIGRGTFVLPDPDAPGSTLGSLENYARQAIYSAVQLPGDQLRYELYAFDGYYIDRITVEPTVLGVTGTLSGPCGYQDGGLVMPHASVNVNVWFKAGWPDQIPYDLTIKVHDSSLQPGAPLTPKDDYNYAALRTVTGRAADPSVAAADKAPVFGGQTKVVDAEDYPLDRDVVILDLHVIDGSYADSSTIRVTDSSGRPVDWWYVPGGIAFTQPPRSVTAEITFRQGDRDIADRHTATLHLSGMDGDPGGDSILLKAAADHAQTADQAAGTVYPPAAVNTDGASITQLLAGDSLDLALQPGPARHVTSAYAVDRSTGRVIPIYGYGSDGALTASAAQYVPGRAGQTVTGAFAMPESDVDVYVNFASGPISATDFAVKLAVSGPSASGNAQADIAEPGGGQSMRVEAPGDDARFTAQGNEVVVTFDPADGYDIAGLEVTNNATGAPVPYQWISVLQDPAVVTNTDGSGHPADNTDLWSGVAPAPGIEHPSWTPNPEKQIQLTVPAGGVTVHVTYATQSAQPFKAQVVVNDALGTANSRNDAGFPRDEAGTTVLDRLKYAMPGEWIDLDIVVHPGYRIEYVKVVPQSFGIQPGLPVGTDIGGVTYYLHDQSTGFVMPSGDVTVYVKFTTDGVATKNATLVVNGAPTDNMANRATITSPLSGARGPVYVQGRPRAVSARPGVDWVSVDYQWDVDTSAVASITVLTLSGATVPFVQEQDPATGQGRITFPMVQDDVVITLTYKADPAPVGQQVVLHVIDKDGNLAQPILLEHGNYGRLEYAGSTALGAAAQDTGEIGFTASDTGVFQKTASIQVPAGQTVAVTACSDATGLDGNGTVYIESAYVLFEQNGQMIHFDLDPDSLTAAGAVGYTGLHDESSFVVHPGRNDVYVTLTRVRPDKDEHAAVLMLRSPSADTQSEAGIHADQSVAAWNSADPARRDKVRANDPADTHAYVTATDGEKITISVEPASGYIIDSIQITPLGFPLDADPVYAFSRTGNTITFDMPHVNVAVTVYLRRGSNTSFNATLHYIQDPNCLALGKPPQEEDYAKLSWTPAGESAVSIWADAKAVGNPGASNQPWNDVSSMTVREGSTVTLDVTLDSDPDTGASDVILSAFVVWKDRGAIVPLTPTYPTGLTVLTGLEGAAESASGAPGNDNTLSDATATFEMPMGDVEVYVVVTTVPPTEPWHTVALVATDHSPTGNNSGLNQGDLWNHNNASDKRVAKSDNVPTIAWVAVTESETISVLPRAGVGYRFDDPAVMTGNDGVTRNLTTPYANFLYDVSSILCNQVIRIDFESGDDLELTVEIQDPDNPGDGTVEQTVTADPAGALPATLRLTSNSVAGSYQVMRGIASGGDVAVTAQPYRGDGVEYSVYATLYLFDGTSQAVPLTDSDGDGVWEGSFPMPSNNARVVFTFYQGYTGTLTLVNRVPGDATGQAAMEEDSRGLPPLSVHSMRTSDSFQSLPNATTLDAYITSSMTGRTVKGLLTRQGVTTLLPATPSGVLGEADHFYHTIDRADAEITLILDSSTAHPNSYLAAVDWVDLPDGVAHPTVEADPGQLRGDDGTWTTADRGDQVTLTLTVPTGYRATVRADGGGDVTLSPAGPFTGPLNDQTVTFTMPARDVQLTVTYEKTIFDLTLRIVDATTDPHANSTRVTPGDLTADGQSTTLAAGANVSVSATTPDPASAGTDRQPHVAAVYYQTASGATTWLQASAMAPGANFNQSFAMPSDDVTVTVVYHEDHFGATESAYYIASVEVVDPDHVPGNRAVSIIDQPDGGLPEDSPRWAAGYAGSGMKVSYEAANGYYVTVTARRADNSDSIPVLQLGSATNGTASVTMPNANIIITLTYTKGEPPEGTANPVALQLLGHKAVSSNQATTTNFTSPAQLSGLTTSGTTPDHAPHMPAYTLPTDPVETVRPAAALGDDLRTLAGAAVGSQVERMTVSVRKVTREGGAVTAIQETPEVDLLVSKYASSATSRAPAPITQSADEEIVIRVYYSSIYTATFHLVGQSAADTHSATDADKTTGAALGYTGAYDAANILLTKPIRNHLDRMEGYRGDGSEEVRTTAAAGPGRRVVDVVWESDLTGAASADPNGSDRYDFTMPADDVDFYAIFEPDDPADRAYVAKVAFDPASQHRDDPGNAVTIQNLTNAAAVGGRYWTEARGQDSVAITVKVAPGYQAQIVTTKIDDPAQLGNLPQLDDGGSLRAPTAADPYQYYITRTVFAPNLPGGKEAVFTMPADTDATVTVKFTRGYDLALDVHDATQIAANAASGTNRADVTYAQGTAQSDSLYWNAQADGSSSNVQITSSTSLYNREGGADVDTKVTPYTSGVGVKILRYTPFTGTALRTSGAGNTTDSFTMPYEDTVVSVLLRESDAKDDLLARVELVGDSDVTGNTATPIVDNTDPVSTTTGAVWTTTSAGNTIDLTLTVAKGYMAKIKVRRDDSYVGYESDPSQWVYLDAQKYGFTRVWEDGSGPNQTAPMAAAPGVTQVQMGYSAGLLPRQTFPDSVSGVQHFRFTMPTNDGGDSETDVTVLVEFVRSSDMPRPFDPRNVNGIVRGVTYDHQPSFLEEGFIYGENHGEYAVVEIPTLAMEEEGVGLHLYDTDNYDEPTSGDRADKQPALDVRRFSFYLSSVSDDGTETYQRLDPGTDVVLAPWREEELEDPADPYNYYLGAAQGMWTGDNSRYWKENSQDTHTDHDFVGSKFKLLPAPPDPETGLRSAGSQALYEMLNNQGSLELSGGKYRTRLVVRAEDAANASDYTEVWIRPWFALGVKVTSYGPTHPLEGRLYRLMTEHELNVANGYWDEAEHPIPGAAAAHETPDAKNFRHYKWDEDAQPMLEDAVVLDGEGQGKWLQFLRLRSSELLGGFTSSYDPSETGRTLLDNVASGQNLTYALELTKTSNLTYTRVALDLDPKSSDYATTPLTDFYEEVDGRPDPSTRTFMLQDAVQLIAGDVDQNGTTKVQDYDAVYDFVYRSKKWTAVREAPVLPASGPDDAYTAALADWALSVYNPASAAYRCDLDGDRHLTVVDLNIVNTRFNYNRTVEDYHWYHRADLSSPWQHDLPFGMGPRDANVYDALFALRSIGEGEVFPDPYWDEAVDPAQLSAVPLETYFVDGDGSFRLDTQAPEDPAAAPSPEPAAPVPDHDERVETPRGEEALENS